MCAEDKHIDRCRSHCGGATILTTSLNIYVHRSEQASSISVALVFLPGHLRSDSTISIYPLNFYITCRWLRAIDMDMESLKLECIA